MAIIALTRKDATMFALETIRAVLVASKAFKDAILEIDELKIQTSDTQEEEKNGAFRTMGYKGMVVFFQEGKRSMSYPFSGMLTIGDSSGKGNWKYASGMIKMRTPESNWERKFSFTRQIDGDLKMEEGTHLREEVIF